MPKTPLFRILGAAVLALCAVGAPAAESWSAETVQARRAAAPTWDELAHTRWIADGRNDAPRKVYVFMDANCKYCTKFWSDARPWVDSGQVQLRHIMVGVIAPSSAGKAATLLGDADPSRRLDAFERAHAFGVARMMAGGQRHSLEDPALQPAATMPADIVRQLDEHLHLMRALGLQGTPGIVFRASNGQVVSRPGLTPEELPQVLGGPR
jgi:thiol:disulfide interchange protein DsbG